jgi:four helix bundle protein
VVGTYRDLLVWQKSMALVEGLYAVTEQMPRSEVFGLTSQIRRAAVSIPSNIAEGKALGGGNYSRHIKIALGSEAELQTQIELARRLKMLSEPDANDLSQRTSEVGRMLVGLLKTLTKDDHAR